MDGSNKNQGDIKVGNCAFENVTPNLVVPQINGGWGNKNTSELVSQHVIDQIVLDKHQENSSKLLTSKCGNRSHDK